MANEIEPDTFLISGVRSEEDVMRREETELLGLEIGRGEAVAILPGTHSKHCVLRNGAMVSFRTFMSGELHALLGSHGILRQSVGPGWDEAAFLEGIDASIREPLTSSLFKVRTRSLLHKKSPESNGSFLSGLLIGAELSALPEGVPLILAAAGSIAAHYQVAFRALSRLFELQRLPGNMLLCSIFFANRPDTKEHAIISENIRKVMRSGQNGATPYEDIEYDPYSPATGATLIDEKTGISHKIDDTGNNTLHKSLYESSFTLRPDTGVVMSFVLKCPPVPEVEPGQKPPKQTITIQTPKIKEPFRNIVIPQNECEVIKFHPN